MRIWLVTVGEPLPTDAGSSRLLRAGILSQLLADAGHEVVWWTSTFDHSRKRQRFDRDTVLALDNGVTVRLLHGIEYSSNVALARIRNHIQVARRFAKEAEGQPVPDIVLCSLPTLELSLEATRYGARHKVPVIVDVRDLWPDLFIELVPKWARWIVEVVLSPMWRQAKQACRTATAITGNSPHFVNWGLKLARRAATPIDRHFWHGYVASAPTKERLDAAYDFWAQFGVIPSDGIFTACFFGAIGQQSELETVIEAAQILAAKGEQFRFVLCGKGDRLEALSKEAVHCPSVIFPGWIDAPQISALMKMSKVGLAMYRSNVGYVSNLPNKPIEYFSAGLPVVSSLSGFLEEFLAKNECGVTFKNGDVDGLVRVLMMLKKEPLKLIQMSENARQLYANQFNAKKVYGEMIIYLQDVASACSKEPFAKVNT